MRYRILLLLILSVLSTIFAYRNNSIGFSVDLDSNWVHDSSNTNEIFFKNTLITEDSILIYEGILGIILYNDITYLSAEEWCNNRSYAMELFVESELIGGVVINRTASILDELYTVIMNFEYTDTDNLTIVSEHIRFVAIGNRGYEIFVTSDTLDMEINYVDYMKILNSFHIYRDKELTKKSNIILNKKSNHCKWNLQKMLSTISYNSELTVLSLSGRVLGKFSGFGRNRIRNIRKKRSLYSGKNILIYKNSHTGEKIPIPIISIPDKY